MARRMKSSILGLFLGLEMCVYDGDSEASGFSQTLTFSLFTQFKAFLAP